MLNRDPNTESLWSQKYRPQTIADCVLPVEIKKQFLGMVESKTIPNMLLSSTTPGIGKTTTALALCRELDADVFFFNASLHSGIDMLRNEITNFCSSVSMSGNRKVIIGDEADNLNCLSEHEFIRLGTLQSSSLVQLKDLQFGMKYPCVSFNMKSGQFEDDTLELISESEKELFEVVLEDGSKIILTSDHPFIIKMNEECIEKTIDGGLNVGDDVVIA